MEGSSSTVGRHEPLHPSRRNGTLLARSVEAEWNAERKDRLEAKLRRLVCGGAMEPAEAQACIRDE
jgi:hypothetical protein